jgi:hypothetical protein
MEGKKQKEKFIITIMGLILASLIILWIIFIVVSIRDIGGSKLTAIEIGINGHHSTNFGLDYDSIHNITDDTCKLEIKVFDGNQNLTIVYNWSWNDGLEIENRFDTIRIEDPIIDFDYIFSIRYLFNSIDPDILNLKLMGEDNAIYGYFFVDKTRNIHISLDENFLNGIEIIDNENIQIPLRYTIRIRPEIEIWD